MVLTAETRSAVVALRDGSTARIEHATEADAPALIEYCETIAGESDFLSFGPGEFGISVDEEVAFVRSLASGARGIMLKAVVDQRVVGMGMLTRSTRPRMRHEGVLALSVLQVHWGRGLGRALMDAVFAAGRTVGVTRVALTVRADNTRAIGLYERYGFLHEGRAVGSTIIDGQPYDVLYMARPA